MCIYREKEILTYIYIYRVCTDTWSGYSIYLPKIIPDSSQGHAEISDLANHQVPRRLQERQMVEFYVAKDGTRKVKGGSDLKSSQSYPKQSLHTTWNGISFVLFTSKTAKTCNKTRECKEKNTL